MAWLKNFSTKKAIPATQLKWNDDDNDSQSIADVINAIKLSIYPVGAIYTSVDPTDPSTLFGGTWERIAQGRALIGAGSITANTTTDHGSVTAGEFAPAVNEAGGAVHHDHILNGTDNNGAKAAIGAVNQSPNMIGYYAVNPSSDGPSSTGAYIVQGSQVSGSGTFSHYTPVYGHTRNNGTVEPYLAVYIWKRVS